LFEQRLLSRDAPAVPTKSPVFLHDSVAWDQQRDGIRRARPGYCSRRAGVPDPPGHFWI